MEGRQTSKLPKKYHLTYIPKFAAEKNGYKRPFSIAERKKKIFHLNQPYWYALTQQLSALPPEQVRAKNEQLKKLYADRQAKRVADNRAG